MDMRHMINTVSVLLEGAEGHNGPPEVRLVKTGCAPLANKMHDVYNVSVGDRKIGTAYGRFTPAKAGYASGHHFSMTLKGQDFSGSKARLLAWVEKMTRDDI